MESVRFTDDSMRGIQGRVSRLTSDVFVCQSFPCSHHSSWLNFAPLSSLMLRMSALPSGCISRSPHSSTPIPAHHPHPINRVHPPLTVTPMGPVGYPPCHKGYQSISSNYVKCDPHNYILANSAVSVSRMGLEIHNLDCAHRSGVVPWSRTWTLYLVFLGLDPTVPHINHVNIDSCLILFLCLICFFIKWRW